MKQGHTGTPPTGPEILDMKVKIWHWLLQQGLGVIVLLAAVWYFEKRYTELEAKFQACQDSKIEALTNTVRRNTETLQILVDKIDKSPGQRRR